MTAIINFSILDVALIIIVINIINIINIIPMIIIITIFIPVIIIMIIDFDKFSARLSALHYITSHSIALTYLRSYRMQV